MVVPPKPVPSAATARLVRVVNLANSKVKTARLGNRGSKGKVVKVGKVVKPAGSVGVASKQQVKPAEACQVMLAIASPVRPATRLVAGPIGIATGLAPMTRAILTSRVTPWRLNKVRTRPMRRARSSRD